MLLLKKKKYAAVKVQFKDGTPYEVFFLEKFSLFYLLFSWKKKPVEQLSWCRILNVKVLTWFVVTGVCYQRNWEISALLKSCQGGMLYHFLPSPLPPFHDHLTLHLAENTRKLSLVMPLALVLAGRVRM